MKSRIHGWTFVLALVAGACTEGTRVNRAGSASNLEELPTFPTRPTTTTSTTRPPGSTTTSSTTSTTSTTGPSGTTTTTGPVATSSTTTTTTTTTTTLRTTTTTNPMPGGAVFPPPFDAQAVYTQTVHVSPSGNDSAAGTREAPFRTLGRALQGAGPGRQVILLAGTYGPLGSFAGLQGTASNPIKIVGEGTVTVSGGSTGLSLQDPRHVVLENIAVQNTSIHGMNIDDGGSYDTPAGPLILRNIRIRNAGTGGNVDCLKMSGVDQFYIDQSEFSNCNAGETIDMVGCHNGIVTRSYFHDTPAHGLQTKGGSSDILIHGNVFRAIAGHSLQMGGSTGDPYVRPLNAPYEGERIRAVANLVLQAGQASFNFQACNECVALHNTVVGPGRYLIRILGGGRDTGPIIRSRNGHVVNNIIQGQVTAGIVNVDSGGNAEPGTFQFANNLWYQINYNGNPGGGVPAETGAIIGQDPQFVNLAGGEYGIQPTSPAVNRGRITDPSWSPNVDRARTGRGNAPDIGAYEANQ